MRKDLLKDCKIAISGMFEEARCPQNIERWVRCHGGSFSTNIDEDTTHLVCTLEAFDIRTFKSEVPTVALFP